MAVDERLHVGRRHRLDVWVGDKAAEKKVVVEGHASDVEGIGLGRVAGEFNDERSYVVRLISEA